MNFVYIFSAFLISTSAFASASQPNDCTTTLFSISDWSVLSAEAQNCLNLNSDFHTAISKLCQADKNHLSEQYAQYLDLKKAYEDAQAIVSSMSNPTASARARLQNARDDWETLGQKSKTELSISDARTAFATCSSN